jgi:hypothetical protein
MSSSSGRLMSWLGGWIFLGTRQRFPRTILQVPKRSSTKLRHGRGTVLRDSFPKPLTHVRLQLILWGSYSIAYAWQSKCYSKRWSPTNLCGWTQVSQDKRIKYIPSSDRLHAIATEIYQLSLRNLFNKFNEKWRKGKMRQGQGARERRVYDRIPNHRHLWDTDGEWVGEKGEICGWVLLLCGIGEGGRCCSPWVFWPSGLHGAWWEVEELLSNCDSLE